MPDKFYDLHQKIQSLAEQMKDPAPCILILGEETKVDNESRVNSALTGLLNIFLKFKDIGINFKEQVSHWIDLFDIFNLILFINCSTPKLWNMAPLIATIFNIWIFAKATSSFFIKMEN